VVLQSRNDVVDNNLVQELVWETELTERHGL